jgi:hypothetical protein
VSHKAQISAAASSPVTLDELPRQAGLRRPGSRAQINTVYSRHVADPRALVESSQVNHRAGTMLSPSASHVTNRVRDIAHQTLPLEPRGITPAGSPNTQPFVRLSMGHLQYVVRIPRRVIVRFSRDTKLASSHRISGLITT